MTKQAQTTPNTLTDDSLDEISGGPHFRNFHGASFDFQSGCDTVLSKTSDIEITSVQTTETTTR